MNSVRSNNVSLKYLRPTPSSCKDIGIRKLKFVAKTQFLYFIIVLSKRKCLKIDKQLKDKIEDSQAFI